MARRGCIVAAGNRRQSILFEPADDALYRDMLAERCWRREKKASAKVATPHHEL
jgi:hypothetical protein